MLIAVSPFSNGSPSCVASSVSFKQRVEANPVLIAMSPVRNGSQSDVDSSVSFHQQWKTIMRCEGVALGPACDVVLVFSFFIFARHMREQ